MIFFYALWSFLANFLLSFAREQAPMVLSFSAIIEFVFFSIVFFLIVRSKIVKRLIVIFCVAGVIAEVILLFMRISNFDFWAALTTCVLCLTYSIVFFYEQVNAPEALMIYQTYRFWIVLGCIVYLSGTLFVFMITSGLKDKEHSAYWNLDIVFEIVKYVFFAIGFLVAQSNRAEPAAQDNFEASMFEKPF